MILLDATKTAKAGHLSGLTRVNRRLQHALGPAARAIIWEDWGAPTTTKQDWFLTAELFSEQEGATRHHGPACPAPLPLRRDLPRRDPSQVPP